ncbi:MAG: class I mannose-6-phosphate isomerase [Paraprevotella sp.]|nr:class I mannose-6-phosphate isomerase [Paraprevotella sp.]
MKNKLFRFTEIFKETLWGGHRILSFKGLDADSRLIGESWELSGMPGHLSVVKGGDSDGLTLAQLIEKEGTALVGEENFARFGTDFPLLIKFIDAAQPLSVQVHPNDELARRRHGCPGKTEMWYVGDCDPDAYLLDGFNRVVTADEYAARVADQTLPEVLRRYDVRRGDVYYLPAGRVHSIGSGCFICEILQSSDVTYRIYDFGRVDREGHPRQLHVEEAKEAIDFTVSAPEVRREVVDNMPTELVRIPYFTTGVYRLTEPMTCDYSELDSFVILICTEGVCHVSCGEEEELLTAGHTLLLAAEADTVRLTPEGKTIILESYV